MICSGWKRRAYSRAAGNVNLKDWRATLETRAWANFEVIEVLHQAEQRDWTSHGRRRRRRLEEPSASSDDVSVARLLPARELHVELAIESKRNSALSMTEVKKPTLMLASGFLLFIRRLRRPLRPASGGDGSAPSPRLRE
jgi:hypothetical protein